MMYGRLDVLNAFRLMIFSIHDGFIGPEYLFFSAYSSLFTLLSVLFPASIPSMCQWLPKFTCLTQTWLWIPDHVSSCVLDISTWMFQRPVQFNMSSIPLALLFSSIPYLRYFPLFLLYNSPPSSVAMNFLRVSKICLLPPSPLSPLSSSWLKSRMII